jgi:hypothetical protein
LLLIDTGADVTLLPLGAVKAAGIEQTGALYELLAFEADRVPLERYALIC